MDIGNPIKGNMNHFRISLVTESIACFTGFPRAIFFPPLILPMPLVSAVASLGFGFCSPRDSPLRLRLFCQLEVSQLLLAELFA